MEEDTLSLKSLCISAVSSGSGKTLLTTALLHHFKTRVRPFKIGPDYIDPQFHKKVSGVESINLDSFIMSEEQVEWLYARYADKAYAVLEGVMGFYDGDDKGCSAYSISKLLHVPSVLVLDCRGSYITVSAVLGGLLAYKKDNTIAAVVLNHISSKSHYELIRTIVEKDHPGIVVLGWIQKGLKALESRHLGLDLEELDTIGEISEAVLEHIDLDALEKLMSGFGKSPQCSNYPFEKIQMQNKHLAVVSDRCFSFLYHDNLEFFKEVFQKVTLVRGCEDEEIPADADAVFLCGGYVETKEAYAKLKTAHRFKNSLRRHAVSKSVYGECAGLLYLGKNVDEKEMSGILELSFTLGERFARLGYYYSETGVKGHSFHYTQPTDTNGGFDILSKKPGGKGSVGSWQSNKVFGTYLHTMFRAYPSLILRYM